MCCWHALAQKHFAVLQALALGESAIDWTPETDDHTLPDLAGMERSRVCVSTFRSLHLCLRCGLSVVFIVGGDVRLLTPAPKPGYLSVFHLDCTKIRVFTSHLPVCLHRHVFIPGIHLS
jgi:hypothetical protein